MDDILFRLTNRPLTTLAGWTALAVLFVLACMVLVPALRHRAVRGLDMLGMNLRWALRSMARQAGTTSLAVVSLAIGIGVSVAIFTMVDVLMIRPLPYDEAGRLVDVFGTVPARGWRTTTQSLPDVLDLRDQSQTMDLAGYSVTSFNLSGNGDPERVKGLRVSWNFFAVLRAQPVVGRSFRPDEEEVGNHRVAVISSGLWQRRFGADSQVIGRSLRLDGEVYTVIGVLPASFWFDGRSTEVWTPLFATGEEPRSNRGMQSVARLNPGVTQERAHIEAEGIARRLERAYPESNAGWGAGVRPLRERFFNRELRTGSLISAVAVGFLLLIVCANVANLQLARAGERRREIAVRASLGANRGQLTRLVMTESAVVAVVGGAFGTFLAVVGVRALVSFIPTWLPRIDAIGTDGRALLFAVATTTLTGLAVGALPALRCARSESSPALKEGGRGAVSRTRGVLTQTLVVVEVSLALTLMVCCALLVQGFDRLQRLDWGWNPENVLTFKVALPESRYASDESVSRFFEQLDSDLQTLHGVEAAGGTEILPLQGESSTYYNVVGQEVPRNDRPSFSVRVVMPGYFQAMGIEVARGRPITEQDRPDGPPAVVINEVLADRHWPGRNPVGQRMRFWGDDSEIVGVVRTTLDFGPDTRPMGFIPAAQLPLRDMSVVIRSRQEPESLAGAVRSAVTALDPDLPVFDVVTMADLMGEENGGYSVMPRLMAGLAAIALSLGLIGVYGVVAKSVAQRTHEVGIRMALGAMRLDVLGMVLKQGMTLVGTGVVLGLVISAVVTRSLALFLFGVNPFHALTFGLVALTVLAAGVLATFMPARRATLVDPIRALRAE